MLPSQAARYTDGRRKTASATTLSEPSSSTDTLATPQVALQARHMCQPPLKLPSPEVICRKRTLPLPHRRAAPLSRQQLTDVLLSGHCGGIGVCRLIEVYYSTHRGLLLGSQRPVRHSGSPGEVSRPPETPQQADIRSVDD